MKVGDKIIITRWKFNFWDERLNEAKYVGNGTVADIIGNTIQIKFLVEFGFLKFTYWKWYNLSDRRFSFNV